MNEKKEQLSVTSRSVTPSRATQIFVVMTLSFVINLASCSSRKDEKTAPPPATKKSETWDYDKIRQVRDDERATTPVDVPKSPEATLTDECTIVTAAQMQQAKLHGCRKLDSRLGHGENSFCCPRQIK
jgi:hypothetical protein